MKPRRSGSPAAAFIVIRHRSTARTRPSNDRPRPQSAFDEDFPTLWERSGGGWVGYRPRHS